MGEYGSELEKEADWLRVRVADLVAECVALHEELQSRRMPSLDETELSSVRADLLLARARVAELEEAVTAKEEDRLLARQKLDCAHTNNNSLRARVAELEAERSQLLKTNDHYRDEITHNAETIARYGLELVEARAEAESMLATAVDVLPGDYKLPWDTGPDPEATITVCDFCLRACCWQGVFMCDEAKGAGTVEKTRAELEELSREHPQYWEPQE